MATSSSHDRRAPPRAEAYFELRTLLEEGRIALSREYASELTRELTAISWTVNGSGKVLIESKVDVRAKLGGQSPDFADALAMAFANDGAIDFDIWWHGAPVAF